MRGACCCQEHQREQAAALNAQNAEALKGECKASPSLLPTPDTATCGKLGTLHLNDLRDCVALVTLGSAFGWPLQRLELATSGTKEVLVARLLQQQNLALSAAAAANVQ